MTTKNYSTDYQLYWNIKQVVDASKMAFYRQVNFLMVHTYFEIGRMIVENEQQGQVRAAYAQQTLKKLSEELSREYGKGYSKRNLDFMKKFYLTYQHRIVQTLFAQFQSAENEGDIKQNGEIEPSSVIKTLPEEFSKLEFPFKVSWSHYLRLIRLKDPLERDFYEIECARQSWSLKELNRQVNSALFHRLALSRNQERVHALAREGQTIEKPKDASNYPFSLLFVEGISCNFEPI